eukprot:IDg22801t1
MMLDQELKQPGAAKRAMLREFMQGVSAQDSILKARAKESEIGSRRKSDARH